jgi:hypothetical protein
MDESDDDDGRWQDDDKDDAKAKQQSDGLRVRTVL